LEATCQRCHETLRETDRYCPACGLPQLIYIAAEMPSLSLEEGAVPNYGDGLQGLTDGVAWRPALKAALMLAIPAGILSSAITPIGASLGLFWMIGAAAWAVGLYFKRAQPGRITLGSGARIGLVTGLFACWLMLSVNGVVLWVSRFAMHQGNQMDAMWAAEVANSLQLSKQMVSQMGLTAAQAAQSTQMSQAWMLSPEGRAGIALTTFVAGAIFLICFAMIGGALGARFLAQSRRPSA
jgi:hypothetical protein